MWLIFKLGENKMHPSLAEHGKEVAAAALAAPKFEIAAGPTWIPRVPFLGGIYVLWKKKGECWSPCYVGESSNLRDRLDEMTRLGRHNALWKLAASNVRNSSVLADPEIVGISISYVVIPIGRKEAEDYLIALWRRNLVNKYDRRFQRRTDWEMFRALDQGQNPIGSTQMLPSEVTDATSGEERL